jgi:hypothetical protein
MSKNDLLSRTPDFVWDEKFWLPAGSTWANLAEHNKFSFENHVLYPVYTGIALYIVRILFET